MALAQYLYDPDYYEFFKELLAKGRFVVLDNGAYEGAQISERELLHWVRRLRPTAVVLPDKPHDLLETTKRSASFLDKLDVSVAMWKVLHAEEGKLEDFIVSYINDSRMYNGVCFSRLTEQYSPAVSSQRLWFIKHLRDSGYWNPETYHHCLGFWNGDWQEVKSLAQLGCIDSIDSSYPLWRAAGVLGNYNPWASMSDSYMATFPNRLERAVAGCR